MPYWHDVVVPDLQAGKLVLISAHGNSLRALAKHLDQIDEDAIAELNIPTGMPLVYELGPDMMPIEAKTTLARSLDPAAAAEAAEAVSKQAG